MSGLFESIELDENAQRVACRKAQVLADTRVNKQLGAFLAQASTPGDFDSRVSIVADDLRGIVEASCADVGYERPEATYRAILAHYRPQDVAHDVRTASTHVARGRVKMCPYHKEVTDISLAAGDATAGFNAMAQHAWGAQHCKGEGFEGSCNFKPEMVTQKFWDDRTEKAQERKREREEQQMAPEFSEAPEGFDEAPVAEALPESTQEPVGEVVDFPEQSEAPVAEAPAEPLQMAASTHAQIRGGHFLAASEPEAAAPAPAGPSSIPSTPHMDPGKIQEAMQVLQQAAMSNGGSQQQQRAMTLLGELSGTLFGGVTSSRTSAVAPIAPMPKSFVPGLGMETPMPAPATPMPGMQPGAQAGGPPMTPAQLQLQQAMMEQQRAQQGQPGSMAPEHVPPATPPATPVPTIASWRPRVGNIILSKKVPCPSCGGDGKGAGGVKCSKCHGAGKVDDWGSSVLDELDNKTSADGNTGLGKPEPKIDKRLWTPKNLAEPVVDDSKQHPTKRKDILEPIAYRNDAPLEEIGEQTTERVKLPKAKGDSGFKPGGQRAPKTDTWHTNEGQTDPVTSGFVPQELVAQAFTAARRY